MPPRDPFDDLNFADFELRDEALRDLEERINKAPVDTRDALASYNPIADRFQQEVINSQAQTIRVVAPAGSGKTQTVVNRVLSQIRAGSSPQRILVLTFDKSAETSLKAKFAEELNQLRIGINGLRISTLNAFGYGLLRDYVPKEFKNVVPDHRTRLFLKDAKEALKTKSVDTFNALPTNIKGKFYLEFFSLLKNELYDPRKFAPQRFADFLLHQKLAEPFFKNPTNRASVKLAIQAVAWLYMAYERRMQAERVLDFDDQKLRAYLSLKDSAELLQTVQSQYSEIIVDEFQDINRLDFVFIQAISEKARLVVTGDDDQAIYGFRGCTPDFIIDLEKYINRPTTSFELQVNYRCPVNIVEHADRLIKHNHRRIPKAPIAHSTTRSQINVISSGTAGLEAKAILRFIENTKRQNAKLGFNDFAVLYRTNAQSLPLQIEFILNRVPYYVRDSDNVLTNETLTLLLGVLRLKLAIANAEPSSPDDSVLAIKSYFRFVNTSESARLHRLFRNRHNFMDVIQSEEFFRILPKARQSKLYSSMQLMLGTNSLLETLDVLGKNFNGLERMIGSLEEVADEQVPMGEIYEIAKNFRGDTKAFVKTIQSALDQAKASGAGKDKESGISLLTYFKSKGLQWHTVILTTCNEGLIPHRRAPIEDERRLFYVALTRTSANLLLSYVKKTCNNKVDPSRFLGEAGLLT